MTERLARRWSALLGLAVLYGCAAAPEGGRPKAEPPAPDHPTVTVTTEPIAPAAPGGPSGPVALPTVPPRADPLPSESGPGVPAQPTPPGTRPGGGVAQAPPGRPITQPARPGRQIVLNFDNADIEAVIQAASEIAGFNYTIGPGVAGKKVTIHTSGRIPEDEVFNVLLAVLEINGVTAIRSGNLYKILPTTAARERPLPTVVGGQADPTRRDDEVITQIVPLQHAPADRMAATLRPFVQGGNIIVQGNLLIVTDTAANIARLLQIVGVLDLEVATDDLRLITVRYADAIELGRTLNEFFTGRRVRTAGPRYHRPLRPPRVPACHRRRASPPAIPATGLR